jgi:hypothetical protein
VARSKEARYGLAACFEAGGARFGGTIAVLLTTLAMISVFGERSGPGLAFSARFHHPEPAHETEAQQSVLPLA